MGKRTFVNLVFFLFVFGVMCVWAVGNLVTIDQIERPYVITADFEAASGVMPNAEVAYLGVNYGRVTEVEREPGHVHVTMKIDRDKEIPAGSIARIFRKSALGEPYIDFNPPDDYKVGNTDFIPEGFNVPMEQTQIPLEFSELLRSASRLLASIEPGKAGSLISELAQALEGNADDIRGFVTATDELAATFAAKTDVLDRLATNNTTITRVVAERAGDIGQSITNLRALADTLDTINGRGDFDTLFNSGSELIGRLADIVESQKGNLDCIFHDVADVLDLTSSPEQLANLDRLLEVGPNGFGQVLNSIDYEPDGAWVRVNLLLTETLSTPPKEYVPHLEPPAPVEIPACDSPFNGTASGPDFEPDVVLAQSAAPAAPASLSRTGGSAIGGGAAILLAAAVAFRLVTRAQRR